MNVLTIFSAIATSNVEDVRTVLDYYRSEDDVIEAFKRNQAKLREQQELFNQKQKEQGSQWGGLFGRRLFGGQSTQVRLQLGNVSSYLWLLSTLYNEIKMINILLNAECDTRFVRIGRRADDGESHAFASGKQISNL